MGRRTIVALLIILATWAATGCKIKPGYNWERFGDTSSLAADKQAHVAHVNEQ